MEKLIKIENVKLGDLVCIPEELGNGVIRTCVRVSMIDNINDMYILLSGNGNVIKRLIGREVELIK